jgi:hypothetical protein
LGFSIPSQAREGLSGDSGCIVLACARPCSVGRFALRTGHEQRDRITHRWNPIGTSFHFPPNPSKIKKVANAQRAKVVSS